MMEFVERRYFLLITLWLATAWAENLQTVDPYVDAPPLVGRPLNRCYDSRRRAQRCIPEFVNAAYNVRVESTNTCGLREATEYCLQTAGAKKACEVCEGPASHSPDFLTDFNNNDNQTWWQSETMFEDIQYPNGVNLTLSLGKAFDITYVRLKFHSPRPESFAIYKRTREDGLWIPYQFYSATCDKTFNIPEDAYVTRGDETRAICTKEFSDISPLTGGNVAFSTLEGRPGAYDFENSPILQEWVTATDIRITLVRLNTFGDEVFKDPTVLKSYYYAVSDFAVGGRCKCNGHATECLLTSSGERRGEERRLRCQCEHNTDGPDCEKCKDFYNDQPWGRATSKSAHECQPCNCNGRSTKCYFDRALWDQTGHGGHCVDCTENTDGPNCDRCKDHFFETADGRCSPCSCDILGSRSLQCNQKGQCLCKPGVEGERCDRCAPNFYDFSALGCRPCGCSDAGSEGNAPTCDPSSGSCLCKENVEGQRCDRCKPGFFDLESQHRFGCLPCFCFGHSSVCRSAPGYSRLRIESTFSRDRERWRAVEQSGKEHQFQYNAVIKNIGVSAPSREPLYFIAPVRYLGDQRSSYNGELSFTLRVGEDGPQPTVEDVILEGAGLRVSQPIFGQENPLPSNRNQEYSFRLHENPSYGWSPRLSARDFMSVLSNLTALKIRVTYMHEGSGYLDDVRLDSAQRSASGHEVTTIEMCTCPDSYVGQFCESCAPGFRHDPPGGGRFASCVPCNCHGHAEYCDSHSGRCICQHNTAGDNCDRCAPGYYGNALQGTPSDCQPCPCPDQGACVVLPNEQVACLQCPTGYAGHKCNLCVDGHFGDPSGRQGAPRPCQACQCNTNIDLNAVGNCNTTSGECLKCVYNTAGDKCQRCLPGFFGDALAEIKSDCQACSCYAPGTVDRSVSCDSRTGQCPCKNHVTGRQCNQCQDGFWNLDGGRGCEACNCDPVGSFNRSCNVRTGQCHCRPGVTGLRCDACLAYHYGYSVQGCQDCECDPVGSTAAQCNPNGQCPCRPNVEGRRCQRCKENKYNKEAGCVDCPPCYGLVQEAVNEHRFKLSELANLLDEIEKNPQVIDDVNFERKLQEVVERVEELLKDARNAAGEDGNLVGKLKELAERIAAVRETIGKIEGTVTEASGASGRGVKNVTRAEEIIKRTQEMLQSIRKHLDTEGWEALERANKRSQESGAKSVNMAEIAREARKLANDHEEEAGRIDSIGTESLNTSNEAYHLAKDAIDIQKQTGDDIKNLRRELSEVTDLVGRTKKLADDVQKESRKAYDDALDIYTGAESLIPPKVDVLVMKDKADDIIEEAQRIKGEADNLMGEHKNTLDSLDGKKKEAEDLLGEGTRQQQITDEMLADADAALDKAQKAVNSGEKTLQDAKDTLRTVTEFDDDVRASKEEANHTLSKVGAIEKLVADAESKTKDAEEALSGAEQDAAAARDIAREAQKVAEAASKEAEGIRGEADRTRDKASKLSDQANDLQGQVADTAAKMAEYEGEAKDDEKLAKEALERANQAKLSSVDASRKVKDALKTVNGILDSLDELDDIDTDLLDDLERRLAEAEHELSEAQLDTRTTELRLARETQRSFMRDYDEEIEQLKRDVTNIAEIDASLPDQCYRRVVLEP